MHGPKNKIQNRHSQCVAGAVVRTVPSKLLLRGKYCDVSCTTTPVITLPSYGVQI